MINEDRDDYVKNVSELKVFPWVPESVRRLNEAGFEVIVISNQQGVPKGIIAEHDLQAIQNEISTQVSAAGGRIRSFYYCKHLASESCECRKPQPGLLRRAAVENNVELAETFMVGDAGRDIIAGQSAGCRTVLVLSGHVKRSDIGSLPCEPEHIADDLSGAVDYVIGQLSPTR